MNRKLRFALLATMVIPAVSMAGIDMTIMEDPGATASQASFTVKASSNMGDEMIGAYMVNLALSDASAGLLPASIDVDNLVPGFTLLGTGLGATHDASGMQSGVADGTGITVLAGLNTANIGAAMTDLFRVTVNFDTAAFVDGASFKASLLGGSEIGDVALGAGVAASSTLAAPSAVPEPSSFVLLGLVAAGFLGKRFYGSKKENTEE